MRFLRKIREGNSGATERMEPTGGWKEKPNKSGRCGACPGYEAGGVLAVRAVRLPRAAREPRPAAMGRAWD